MNYIKHLAGFFEKVSEDERLNPTHISMYVCLFQFWNANRFLNPISVSRSELMRISKISAKATYHKCMNELHNFGYLRYQPSYNPFKGSLIYLFNFQETTEQATNLNHTKKQTSAEQAVNAHHTKIETSTEQALEPYINNTNSINQTKENKDKQAKKQAGQKLNKCSPPVLVNDLPEEKEKLRQKKKTFLVGEGQPHFDQVAEYFRLLHFPELEANKFYNYFQSNGWLVGGRARMKDWQAAARNWMLNATANTQPAFLVKGNPASATPKAKHLHATTAKNYREPL